jgi:hypothetical protein
MLDAFNLLGEAYVHGLMKGEVLKLPGREEQIYLLRDNSVEITSSSISFKTVVESQCSMPWYYDDLLLP